MTRLTALTVAAVMLLSACLPSMMLTPSDGKNGPTTTTTVPKNPTTTTTVPKNQVPKNEAAS